METRLRQGYDGQVKRHYRPDRVKKYEARWYVDGRLKCRFFASEAERERFIEDAEEQLSENGKSLLLGFDPAKIHHWLHGPPDLPLSSKALAKGEQEPECAL